MRNRKPFISESRLRSIVRKNLNEELKFDGAKLQDLGVPMAAKYSLSGAKELKYLDEYRKLIKLIELELGEMWDKVVESDNNLAEYVIKLCKVITDATGGNIQISPENFHPIWPNCPGDVSNAAAEMLGNDNRSILLSGEGEISPEAIEHILEAYEIDGDTEYDTDNINDVIQTVMEKNGLDWNICHFWVNKDQSNPGRYYWDAGIEYDEALSSMDSISDVLARPWGRQ